MEQDSGRTSPTVDCATALQEVQKNATTFTTDLNQLLVEYN